jgi:hypothetical protein
MICSKSAQNKLVVLADLPNCSVPNIGVIPSQYLFPSVGRLNKEPAFNLHSDGSIYQLFRMKEFSALQMNRMVENMPENTSLQIFRIHQPLREMDSYFVCIRADIEYDFIDLEGKNIFNKFAASTSIYCNMIEKVTKERYEQCAGLIPENAEIAKIEGNELYGYLCDYENDEDYAFTKHPVKSNISAILTGKSKHTSVFSINNLDAVPMHYGILNENEFLEIITIVKPSKKQEKEIDKTISTNKEILDAIRPDDVEGRGIGVDTIRKDFTHIMEKIKAGIFFINVSFCMYSKESLADLRNKFRLFEENMYKQGIVLYCHSNSARAQYISLFPGNSVYGEHWNKVYRKFGLMLIVKVMGL